LKPYVQCPGNAAISVAEAPEFRARRLDKKGQPLPIGERVGFLLWFRGSDLELSQHHRVPGFSGSIQQTQEETRFVYLLLESTGSSRTVASENR